MVQNIKEEFDAACARSKLIVALDFDTIHEAIVMVDRLGETVDFYKVGWQLFMGTHFEMLEFLIAAKKQIFLDLKMTDIPTTIQKSLCNIPPNIMNDIKFMTFFGSNNVISAAKKAYPEAYTSFLKVPVLSSYDGYINVEIYRDGIKALDAGADGLVVSGDAIEFVRKYLGDKFYIVSPGIRPDGTDTDDHKRSLTPYKAIKYGADYLVVGRPITTASDPTAVAAAIIQDIAAALSA